MSEDNTPIEEVYTPTELNGELVITKREDGSGGNLTVEGDFNLSGKISRDNIQLATTQEPGAVIVGDGLCVSVAGLLTPEHPKAGEIYLDYLTLGDNTTLYDRTDTSHPIHAAAGYNLGEQAAVNWFNTNIKGCGSTILLNQLPTTSEIVETVSDETEPSPTSAESNLLPTAGAVVEYFRVQIDGLDLSGTYSLVDHTHVVADIDGLGDAATKNLADSIAVGQTGLVSGAQVYLYIDGLNLRDTYALKTHYHRLGDIYWGGNMPFAQGTVISSTSTDSDLATGKAVFDFVTATCAPAVHTHTLSAITDAGTAAGLNAGTGAGNVPVLDGAGKLSISMMPERVIGGEYLGEVADEAAMIATITATVGDFVKRTDTGTYWMLGINSDGAYATAANWFEYAGAVSSVNGATGLVTQAQIGLETTLTTTSDVKFPSSKAVATYVSDRLGTLTLGDIHANPSTVFTLAALPNGETYQLPTLLKVNDLISTATNGITVTSDKISDLVDDASEIDTGAGYAVSDYAVSEYVATKINALNLGEAATKNIASAIAVGQTGLVTGAQVYLYIDGLNLANTYAPKSHQHPLTQIYAGGNMTLDRATVISSSSTDYLLATGKAVYDYAASKTHTHPLSFIVDNSNVAYSAGTSISSSSTDNQLATAKAVYDTLEAFSPSVSSADISDAISTAEGITDSAAGLTQGKAVMAFAEGLSKKKLTYLSTGTIPVTKSGQAFIYSVANGVNVTLDDSGLKADGDEIVETTIYLCGADEMTEITTLTDVRWKNAADNIPVLSLNQIVEIKLRRVSGFWLGEWDWYNLPTTGIVWVTTLSDATEHTGTSLRDAISSATAGNTIRFSPELNGSIVLEQGTLVISKALTIDGGGRITIDGNSRASLLKVTDSITENTTLKALTFTRGTVGSQDKRAGGITASSPLTIEDCVIMQCSASTGGSSMYNNYRFAGGVYSTSNLTLCRCTIKENTARSMDSLTNYAAGIMFDSQSGTIQAINTLFVDNTATRTANTNYGYGVFATGNASYINCTFANNSFIATGGTGSGNGVSIRGSLSNVAIVNNSSVVVTLPTVSHCLSDAGTWADLTYDPSLPLFEADGYTPCAGSQLIDAGDSTLNTETTDLNGNPRVVGEAIDIGAIEYQG